MLLLAPTPFFWVLLRFFLDRLSVEGVTERAPMLLAFFSALSLSFTLYLYLTLDRIITLLWGVEGGFFCSMQPWKTGFWPLSFCPFRWRHGVGFFIVEGASSGCFFCSPAPYRRRRVASIWIPSAPIIRKRRRYRPRSASFLVARPLDRLPSSSSASVTEFLPSFFLRLARLFRPNCGRRHVFIEAWAGFNFICFFYWLVLSRSAPRIDCVGVGGGGSSGRIHVLVLLVGLLVLPSFVKDRVWAAATLSRLFGQLHCAPLVPNYIDFSPASFPGST